MLFIKLVKMKKRLLIFILSGILVPTIFFSCKDEDVAKGLITISGITKLDVEANPIGSNDITDWKFTDSWSFSEENLFIKNNSSSTVTESTAPNSSVVVIGYPNPAKSLIFIAFQLEKNMYYDLRVVDKNLNIKLKKDSVKYGGISLGDSAFINNELYRIYYKIHSDNKIYRGHGDFKFIN